MNEPSGNPEQYRIDDLVLDPGARKLSRRGASIQLPKLSFDLLLALVRAAPNVVSTDDLVKIVWEDVVVSDETVTQRVKMLRDVLGKTGDKQRYIETVRSVGYRLRPVVVKTAALESAHQIRGRGRWSIIAATSVLVVVVAAFLYVRPDIQSQGDPTVAKANTLAVLPFVAMSDVPDNAYFADGVTEEVLNALAQVPGFLVTARTSSFYYKDKSVPLDEIAETLGVANILEGSIRRDGDRLRITAQLVRTEDGFHIWSETMDYTLDDVFAVQAAIAENVSTALEVVLDDVQRERMRAVGVRDPRAFIAYQKGIRLFEQAHGGSQRLGLLTQANAHFEEATRRAPELSDAYLKHADYHSHVLLSITSGVDIDRYSSADIATVGQALLADFDAAVRFASDERQRRLAALERAIFVGDWQVLDDRMRAVLDEPSCAISNWLETVALPLGYAAATRPLTARWVACDPLNIEAHVHRARMLLWLGEFEASANTLSETRQALDHPLLRTAQLLALIGMGKSDDAATLISKHPDDAAMQIGGRFWVAVARGNEETARDYLKQFREVLAPNPSDLMAYNALLGDREEVNRIAAHADATQYGHMVLLSALLTCFCGAVFDLEATPNFAGMIDESGLSWPPRQAFNWPLKTW